MKSRTKPDTKANDVHTILSSLEQALRSELVRIIYGSVFLLGTTALLDSRYPGIFHDCTAEGTSW